jgi:hypothetical protein
MCFPVLCTKDARGPEKPAGVGWRELPKRRKPPGVPEGHLLKTCKQKNFKYEPTQFSALPGLVFKFGQERGDSFGFVLIFASFDQAKEERKKKGNSSYR